MNGRIDGFRNELMNVWKDRWRDEKKDGSMEG